MICLKKGPSRNKWFRHRSQICVFSGLVIGWRSKLRAAHPYPTQSWVPPAVCQLFHQISVFSLCLFTHLGKSILESWIFRVAEFLQKSRKWGIMRKTTILKKNKNIMPKIPKTKLINIYWIQLDKHAKKIPNKKKKKTCFTYNHDNHVNL